MTPRRAPLIAGLLVALALGGCAPSSEVVRVGCGEAATAAWPFPVGWLVRSLSLADARAIAEADLGVGPGDAGAAPGVRAEWASVEAASEAGAALWLYEAPAPGPRGIAAVRACEVLATITTAER